jgi:hypothetical protein
MSDNITFAKPLNFDAHFVSLWKWESHKEEKILFNILFSKMKEKRIKEDDRIQVVKVSSNISSEE